LSVSTPIIQSMGSPQNADDWESVDTLADFLEMIGLLAADWDRDEAARIARRSAGLWAAEGESWAQGNPGAWLEAMHEWLASLADSPNLTPVNTDPPSWRTFAFILAKSRYYE